MARPSHPLARPAALVACLTLLLAGAGRGQVDEGLLLVPHLVDAAREAVLVDGQLLVQTAPDTGPARLEALRVLAADDGAALFATPLDHALTGDAELARILEIIERLPDSIAGHRHGPRRMAAPDAATLQGEAAMAAWRDVTDRLEVVRERAALGEPLGFTTVDLTVPLWLLFGDEPAPGDAREVLLEVDWRDPAGATRTSRARTTITWLGALGGVPPSLDAILPGATIHSGDLHVHSCHGEALGACAPSDNCTAESLQVSGAFSYAQLKGQYQALGMDWFTATDHSYCINSGGEYQVIVDECAAITDGAFVVLPDTEVSSDEQGSQSGSDTADLLCLGFTSANHMGAHGITSRKPGGSDGLLGFCDGLFTDELDGFIGNAQDVRAEGGLPVAHHPADGEFGWNSFNATTGIEAGLMHGVEIWNGETQSGQGGHVGQWVDWLLAGRVLYAYSGSDTHDEAFDFGANRLVLGGGQAFDRDGILGALDAGRSFVSNGPTLVLEAVHDGLSLLMGTLQSLPAGGLVPPATIRVHYDFGADTGTITVFRGEVGASAETVLCTSAPLTGAGVFECVGAVATGARGWFRAYANAGGGLRAYTNPVFFLPGGCTYTTYGVGLGGANIGSLTSDDSPAIGSVNALRIADFPDSAVAFLVLGAFPVPTGLPFKGGAILAGTPWLAALPVPLSAGAASVVLAIPYEPSFAGGHLYWQAIAPDGTQPLGFSLSNGLDMGFCAAFP